MEENKTTSAEENKNILSKLELLRKPFEKHQISYRPKFNNKDAKKEECRLCGQYHAGANLESEHLEYVGHAALTDRLLSVDLFWTWEPLSFTSEGLPRFDSSGGLWIKLTILGLTRLGYGNAQLSTFKEVGSREKEVIGDALRNAAMRFGAALDLWHKGDLHKEEQDEDVADKNKQEVLPPESKKIPTEIPNMAPKIEETKQQKMDKFFVSLGLSKMQASSAMIQFFGNPVDLNLIEDVRLREFSLFVKTKMS